MGYTVWSVVADEQPTAAKWNILGTNDASFNDGSGIGTNAITAPKLSTSAINLGFISLSGVFTTSSATAVQVTDMTLTVTIPAGGRSIEIIGQANYLRNGTGAKTSYLALYDGAVGSGTLLDTGIFTSASTNYGGFTQAKAVITPAAGTKTFNLGLITDSGGTAAIGGAGSSYSLHVKAI